MKPGIVHVMRAPIVGGSELETLAITRRLRDWSHRVIYPERFSGWAPSIRDRFPADVPVLAHADVEGHLQAHPPELIHIQFPFLVHPHADHHESVLVFKGLDRSLAARVVFTVHAAVNVPVLPGIHYLFHTESLYERFEHLIERHRVTICPSLVELPETLPSRPRGHPVTILWVSRNEDAKFHPEVEDICFRVRDACPDVRFHFVGRPLHRTLPAESWVQIEPCPAADLETAWTSADLFWYFPDPGLEETWCRAVTEAMAWELPCVVASHGAMAVQVRHGEHGLIVADPAACAEALISLARSEGLRRSMGEKARERAVALGREAERILDGLYRALVARSGSSKE